MERLSFRSTSQLDLIAELHQRDLLREAERVAAQWTRLDPQTGSGTRSRASAAASARRRTASALRGKMCAMRWLIPSSA